jgi:hypothetical protein
MLLRVTIAYGATEKSNSELAAPTGGRLVEAFVSMSSRPTRAMRSTPSPARLEDTTCYPMEMR